MSFQMSKLAKDGKPLLKFVGQVDEEAVFPTFNDLGTEVFIDLSGVTAINSIGIRSWIQWFSQYGSIHFTFINCPKALVMQMNMVEGFLPEKAEVQSMQVPFFCESCDEERELMFEVGREIIVNGDNVTLKYDKTKVCKPDCETELDVSEAKFFRFLTQKNNKAAA